MPGIIIEAAGGVLCKKNPDGELQVAIVHRKRYDGDWTLPKGKLQPGETPLQAALREVCEETGYKARIVNFVGAIGYQIPDGQKLVRFWKMVPESTAAEPIDTSEVVQTDWLELDQALAKMTYPLERALLEACMSSISCDFETIERDSNPPPNLWQRMRLRLLFEDIAYTNIKLTLPVLEEEFAGLYKEIASACLPISCAWAPRVRRLLDRANEVKSSDPELAWRFAKTAERSLLYAEDPLNAGAADARADSLLKEADEKIKSWRGKAIKNLLAGPHPLPVWRVVRAVRLSDEHFDNSFRKLKVLRSRLRTFAAAALIIVGTYIYLAPVAGLLANVTPGRRLPILAIAIVGLMGSVVSALTSTRSVSSELVPTQQAQTTILLSRLALGPLSALAVATLLATGIFNGHVPSYTETLAVAFVSGFSERFVVKSIDAFTQKT